MANPNLLAQLASGGAKLSPDGFARGYAFGQEISTRREDRERKNQLLAAFPDAIKGDENALAAIGRTDPQAYLSIQDYHTKKKAAESAAAEQRLQSFAGTSLYAIDAIERAPEDQRQALYGDMIRRVAQSDPEAFYSLGGAPEQYDPNWAVRARAILIPMAVGREKLAAHYAEQQKPKKFNNPIAGVDPKTGKPKMVQFSEDGEGRDVPNLAPAPPAAGGNRKVVDKPLPSGLIQKVWVDDQGNELGNFGAPVPRVGTGVPTQDERQAAFLLGRIMKAEGDITSATGEDSPEGKRTKAQRDATKPGLWASSVGLVSDMGRNVANSPERQRVEAAQMDALDAALTLATGAAYTKIQLESLRTSYFPQIGDDDTTVSDKKARYDNLIEMAKIRAGRAMPQQVGANPPADGGGGDLSEAERAELEQLRSEQR